MAAPTNTARTTTQVGNREDLSDVISRIAPEETPFMTNIGSGPAPTAIRHEWQLETLRTPNPDNAVLEGDDTGTYAENVTTRVSNICQIFKEAFLVSGSQEVVKKAGRKSEIARQSAIVSRQVKRDVEAALLHDNASRLESGSNARLLGGAQSWLETNTSHGANGGAAGGFNTSTSIVDAPTSGDARTLTEALVKAIQQSIFTESGTMKRRAIYLSPAHKVVFSGFTGIAENRNAMPSRGQATIQGAADLYVSDFGELAAIPVAYGLTGTALIIDHDYWSVGTLRGYRREKLSKTGDNIKYHILCEKTLVCKNEKASGGIYDLS